MDSPSLKTGRAEINDFQVRALLADQEDVLWLEVAVDDAKVVTVSEAGDDLSDQESAEVQT